MKITLRVVLAISLLCLAIGCGTEVDENQSSNNGNGPDPDPTNQTEDRPNYFDEADSLLEVHCEKIFECCSGDQRIQDLGIDASDVEECKQQQRGIFRGVGTAQLDVAIDQGRVEIDTSMIAACENQIAELSCGDFQGTREERRTLPGCQEMVEGVVGLNGTCSADYECESDLCSIPEGEGEGTCQPLPEMGEECLDRRCGGPAYCDRFDDMCKELKQKGSSCGEHEECHTGYCGEEEVNGAFVQECMDRPASCTD